MQTGSRAPMSDHIPCPRCEGQTYDRGSCALCGNRGVLDENGDRVSLRAVVVDGTAPVSRLDGVTASAVRAPIFFAAAVGRLRLLRRGRERCVYCGWRATRRPSGVPTCGEHAELVALDPGYGATP